MDTLGAKLAKKKRRASAKKPADMPPAIGGFVQLPLPLRLNRGAHAAVRRYHFVKQLKAASAAGSGEQPTEGEAEDDARLRTILVANFDGADGDLRRAYGQFGEIESVNPGKAGPTGKGIGRVVFADVGAVNAVMQLTVRSAAAAAATVARAEDELEDAASEQGAGKVDDDGFEVVGSQEEEDDDGFQTVGAEDEGEDFEQGESQAGGAAAESVRVPTGMAKWLAEHFEERMGHAALQNYCDDVLAGYDVRRKENERAAKALLNVPDEDGFITVTSGGRRNTHSDGTVQVKAATAGSAAAAERRIAKNGGVANGAERTFSDFYRFQTRARREDELSSLRTKFEADKRKIVRAKERRDGGLDISGNSRYNPMK